jgi:anti-sigma factor RsiW
MSLSKNELLYLMAYADGEVDDDELSEVEALIAKSDEARRILEQQAALRQWVVDAGDTSATRGRAQGIADVVMATIDEQGGAKLITLERERAKRALNQQRIKEFGALLAVAAAVLLFFLWPSSPEQGPVAQESTKAAAGPSSAAQPAVTPAAPAAPAAAQDTPSAVASAEAEVPSIDVQAVESPEHQFSIFYVPGATGANASASSVVVWIGEE